MCTIRVISAEAFVVLKQIFAALSRGNVTSSK